ncbi:hypothetical protein HQO90_11210 [Rhodococcus fascians]|nr:hypothetical protein [Rhodococcus fascians]
MPATSLLRGQEVGDEARSTLGFSLGPNIVVRVPPEDMKFATLPKTEQPVIAARGDGKSAEIVTPAVLCSQDFRHRFVWAVGYIVVRQQFVRLRLHDSQFLEVCQPLQ